MTLAELRNARSLSQNAVSKQTGLSRKTISDIEDGADVRISTLRKYAKALGVPFSEAYEAYKAVCPEP